MGAYTARDVYILRGTMILKVCDTPVQFHNIHLSVVARLCVHPGLQ